MDMWKGIETMSKRTMIAVCLLTMVSAASGQERKITLQEAIDLALHQNRAMKIAQFDVAAQAQKQRGAKSDYFPVLHNDSNALYVNEVQRVQVPPGGLWAIPRRPALSRPTVFLPPGGKFLF